MYRVGERVRVIDHLEDYSQAHYEHQGQEETIESYDEASRRYRVVACSHCLFREEELIRIQPSKIREGLCYVSKKEFEKGI